ncbi:methyltransferase domain-containing protein [Cytophagaceae bacterium DM2B3-1]|uniref:Methyltransferase domain-containing protein n=1 Tax=Xanthocytophaga flava TaxID=3048013 RepID=A0ABT7CNM2_9BACT|nr:methyltransferase domain-containing protein [Xanthocytophaga flavus]MDJ1473002.1 methyltransferase domain-containing protein [Xanthocytophaga flavus]MDJ1495348.1 methyltransferase domain-containing protein [Xanthocytophaga flavus]
MSSPIVNIQKGIIRKLLIHFHQKASHNRRTCILTQLLKQNIIDCFSTKDTNVHCLDVGCGDMIIAESINESLPNTIWQCIDIHPLPEGLENNAKWKKYKTFDGSYIPFADKSFDVITFCDVLHHAGENTPVLLTEAARTGKIVLIKDHFEYSYYSRLMLKMMDIVGNWAYGINIPERYFTKKRFSKLCEGAGLEIIDMNNHIQLYEHLPIVRTILSPKWQFIAVLKAVN